MAEKVERDILEGKRGMIMKEILYLRKGDEEEEEIFRDKGKIRKGIIS